MKSLFNESDYLEIRIRIESLQIKSQKQWGKMDLAQALAHCSIGFEKAIGIIPFEDKSNFILRTLVKSLVTKALKKGDLGKNQKTFPDFEITEQKDFEVEKKRLLENIDAFYKLGKLSQPGKHPYFGKFSKEEWGALQYVHTDHHLKQFSS